jgi:elongation factor 2
MAKITKFTTEDVQKAMKDLPNVRNIMMLGSMGVGKTNVIDCLGVSCGLVGEDKIGEARCASGRADEKAKGCTYKASVTSLIVDGTLFHMIDAPGHVEYSAEASVVAPMADCALVVMDGSKGQVSAQTSQHVKLMAHWSIDCVLFCNRLDTSFLVTKKEPDEIYYDLSGSVDSFNAALATPPTLNGARAQLDPIAGQVVFGSAGQGWAFTLLTLAAMYAPKLNKEPAAVAKMIWGAKGFVKMVIDPIYSVAKAAEAGDTAKLEKMMKGMGVALKASDLALTEQALFKRVMALWMPAGPAIAACMKQHGLDPVTAQARRFSFITMAPPTDPAAVAIKTTQATGDVAYNIVKMIPQPATPGRFFAMGRVFAGTLTADKGYLLEDDYVPPHAKIEEEAAPPPAEEEGEEEAAEEEEAGPKAPKKKEKTTMQERRIQSVMSCGGKNFGAITSVPAGNICAISGVDQYIVKRSNFCTSKNQFPFKSPFFLVSAVVKVSLSPKNAKELPKVVEGLRRLTKSCPLVEVSLEDSGLHAIAGCGQEHMRILKHDLEEDYLPGIPLKWDDPSVSYRETVTMESSQICLSKSPNKHNRLFIKAEPMTEETNLAIESNRINPMLEPKTRAKILDKEFGWDKTDALKIWGFGPAPEEAGGSYGANCVVDQTKGVQYLLEIKESLNSGLLWAAKQGPICEENMRGIRFNLLDVKLHTDSIHRGMGQIQPTARRVFFASTMMGACRLVEPVFKAEIDATADSSPGIMQALGACRGELVVSEEQGSRIAVEAFVPIAETIGNSPFATVLSQKTNGKAAVNYAFDHWEAMPSDPLKVEPKKNIPQTKAAEIMFAIRTRKGLKVEPPVLTDYLDKL